MPVVAKVRAIRARASQSADLSFNMPGVIAARNFDFSTNLGSAHLGQTVSSFDITTNLYSKLGETLPQSGKILPDARLKFDAAAIRGVFTTSPNAAPSPYLFALRNEALGSVLDQTIAKRENAFLEKYKHVAQIAARLRVSYPEITKHLDTLISNTKARFDMLSAEYVKDGVSVRKSTVASQAVSSDYAVITENTTKSATLATWNAAMPANTPAGSTITTAIKDPNGNLLQQHEMPNAASMPRILNQNGQWDLVNTPEFVSQKVAAKTTSEGTQTTESPDPRYTHPPLENEIEYRQSSQTIHGELIRQDLASLRLPHIERIMENELNIIDLEIRSLQLNVAHTYMIAPFDGVVTALYKDIGESVEAGEPILRLENDGVLLIVGQLQTTSAIRLGVQATITFDLEDSGVMKTLSGNVVSVRGHEADDDEWDIIIQAPNPQDGNGRVVPLNYQFDPDSTSVVFL